jgi:hypothetical protein
MKEKRCIYCDEIKSVVEFHKAKDRPDGYRGDCKSCRKNKSKINYSPKQLRCTKCDFLKDMNENNFHISNKNKFGFRRQCKECHRIQMQECNLKRYYNLDIDGKNKMILEQDNKCLICNLESKLVVDHDHETGEVRGLLCDICNRGIGYLREKNENLWNSILYLNPEFKKKEWSEILKLIKK